MRWVIVSVALAGLIVGWRTFWFLTDDAYIAFRYISNSMLGAGYVWNPAPFLPVEGYTSLAWLWVLEGIWRLTGVQPPDAANWVSLSCSVVTLVLTAEILWRVTESRSHTLRYTLLALGLAFCVTNRTFLAWTSSGLETALFNAGVAAWVYFAVFRFRSEAQVRVAGVPVICGVAALLYLTRPDGILYCAASLALCLPAVARTGRSGWLRLAPAGSGWLRLAPAGSGWLRSSPSRST